MRSPKIIDYLSIAAIIVWAASVWSTMPALLASGQGNAPALLDSWSHFERYFLAPLVCLVFAVVTVVERKLTAHECGLQLGKGSGIEAILVGLLFLTGLASVDGQEFSISSRLVAVMLMITASEIVLRALTISLIGRLFGNSKLVKVAAVIVSGLLFLVVTPTFHDRMLFMGLYFIFASYVVLSNGSILLVLMMDAFAVIRHTPIDTEAGVPLLAIVIFVILAVPIWLVERFRAQPVAQSE